MKDMNEFRRAVYEKAEKKAAEERLRKLKLKKFVVFAACFALIIAPALVALKTGSEDKSGEMYYDGASTPATYRPENYNSGGGQYGDANKDTFYDNLIEEAEGTTPKYTTTRPYFTAASTAVTTRVQTTVATTTPLLSGTEPVPTLTQCIPDTTMSQQTETAGAESGERADVTVGGKSVILKKGMSYAEICKLLGGEGRVALGAPIYTWSCGDGVTLTVRFELTGDADTPYPERMKAVYFTVIR